MDRLYSLMPSIRRARRRGESGQSLIEAAVFLCIAFLFFAYAVDTSWLLYCYVTNFSVSANVAFYAAQGMSSMSQTSLPGEQYSNSTAASPSNQTTDPIGQAWEQYMLLHEGNSFTTSTSQHPTYVSLCSPSIGIKSTSNGGPAPTECAGDQFGSSNTYTASSQYADKIDPESPTYNEIELTIVQTVKPPIPLSFFGANFFPWQQLSFHFYTRALQ